MRSIVALLIVSTFAYLAVSQTTCASPAPAGCASCTGLSALPNQCTSCSTGFLLSGTISGCATACGTGCWTCTNATVCLVCSAGYVLYSTTGVCVALPTGCTAGTATNATSVNCTAVLSTYALSSGVPVACGGTSTSVVGSTTWNPVLNCVACAATATTNKLVTSTLVGSWVTCSQCANGYILLTAFQQVCTAGACSNAAATGLGISTPECIPVNTAVTASTLAAAAGNNILSNSVGITVINTGSNAGCAQGTPTYSSTAPSSLTSIACTMAASGYWCPAATALVGGGTTGQSCQTVTSAAALFPATVPTNCIGGMATATAATSAQTTCQWCTNSSFYLTSTAAANSCVANNASCLTQISATNCTVAATGYTIVNGLVVACSNTTTSCTGGLSTGTIMLATGATITGTAVTGCQYHNASGVCVQCAAFTTSVQNCTACPSNCVNCTLSSGTTSCSTCSSGFNLWSANGSCLAACANGTNRTSNGTCAYSKNMIASVVAFASLVFYYIF